MPVTTLGPARLHWQQTGGEDRPALLLIHPPSLDLTIWDRLVPFLTDRFRVIRLDLPGHGASSMPAGDTAIAEAVAGAWAVLDDAGVDRVLVCGVAAGAVVAGAMAGARPDAIVGLILASPGSGPDVPLPASTPAAETWLYPLRQVQATTPAAGWVDAAGQPSVDPSIPTLRIDPADGPVACVLRPGAFATAIGRFHDTLRPHGLGIDPARNGERVRREVLGDPWVDQSIAARTPWIADYQDYATEVAWHRIWGRAGFDYRTRRLLVLAITASLGRWEEFRLHVRSGLQRGSLSVQDVKELALQTGLYAGVPVANTAFAKCRALFDDLGIDLRDG